ncbi:nuclear transport factor 2 family protein [Streptomyces sp. NPDC019890]|uniref:nuclear transport factor 2 family protein n=1 Tax=Streptomyces sp. NPDC019890 TaxID=3365064 RepID=UPI00384E9692
MQEKSEAVTVDWPQSAPVEHVYLSYAYLNARDYDAFASLLEDDVTVSVPGEVIAIGRAAVISTERGRRVSYSLEDLWAGQGRIVATGVFYRQADSVHGVDFADIFIVSSRGLIASRKTYASVCPTR